MDLVTLLPSQWQPVAHAISGLIAACSVLALTVKPWISPPGPNDGFGKRFLLGLMQVIDLLAANSRTVSSQKEIAKLKRESLL